MVAQSGREPPPQIGRTGGAGGGPWAVVLVALAFVAVNAVQPWSWGEDQRDEATVPGAMTPPIGSPIAAPTPTSRDAGDATPWSGHAADCPAPNSWRIVTLGRWERWLVHSWAAVVPVRAVDPRDPTIPAVPIYADSVVGLGFCAPIGGPLAPATGSTVALWWQPGGAKPVLRIELAGLPDLGNAPGGIWGGLWGRPTVLRIGVPSAIGVPLEPTAVRRPVTGPPAGSSGEAGALPLASPSGSWPPGRYVFLVGDWAVGMEIELGRGR